MVARLKIPIEQVVVMIERHGVKKAAEHLGCDRATIYRTLDRHDLEVGHVVRPRKAKEQTA